MNNNVVYLREALSRRVSWRKFKHHFGIINYTPMQANLAQSYKYLSLTYLNCMKGGNFIFYLHALSILSITVVPFELI